MWWLIPVLLIAALIAFVIYRTINFKPQDNTKVIETEEVFDNDITVKRLQELIKCKTVSYKDKSLEDDKEFDKLIKILPILYPSVFEVCDFKELQDRALLFKWSGKNDGDPAVLMAHYDVVPVNEEMWEKPAFDAIIENGVLWGRGTLDTKVTFNGVLSAAEHLIREGYTPENDIYFAFSGGEEVSGNGALNIVDLFEKAGITPSMVVDEGGAVVENVFPGVSIPCGLIGIAEKGMMDVKYTAKSQGGHASAPKPKTPILSLSKACVKLSKKPFKTHITAPVAQMFDTLGRHSSFLFRMIFANLWLFKPVLTLICNLSGGEMNALMRTTVAFTQSEGSKATNVIPPKASLVSNIRLNPEDTVESAKAYLEKAIGDKDVEVEVMMGMNPSRISVTDCEGFHKVKTAVASTWKGSIVSPYLMVQCSDSRHWGKISDKVYRFSAMDLTSEERATIHGNNEKIRLETVNKAVEFYIRLMKQC